MVLTRSIPVIDIFAGPGGLGEGFASFRDARDSSPFDIRLSVEMDTYAHRTLLLRSFFRKFEREQAPSAYYEYIRGEPAWAGARCTDLLDAFPHQGRDARAECWCEELRPQIADDLDARIDKALGPRRRRGPWVLVGGPPCQAYSLVGRARMLRTMGESFYSDKRHTLYKEYLRLLAKHAPPVFVMENVKGLLSATSQTGARMLQMILADLRRPPGSSHEYRLFALSSSEGATTAPIDEDDDPRRFVIACERHGIPQRRHRLIILGLLASECGKESRPPRSLAATNTPTTISDAIADLPRLRSGLSRGNDSPLGWKRILLDAANSSWLRELMRTVNSDVGRHVLRTSHSVAIPRCDRGGRFIDSPVEPALASWWYSDSRLGGVCNHHSRSHIPADIHRYLFVAAFGKIRRYSPKLQDFPRQLLPRHLNVQAALVSGLFNDRFRVQVSGHPATTITSHIAKDGHYFVHFDPSQCRSLTVREAARIQTFPDNYFFEGPRTQQFHQVGNAVPPLLANGIAAIVFEGLSRNWR